MNFLSEEQITDALKLFHLGEPIIFPTETVYGLGAPLFNETAIAKIFSIKERPLQKPLIVHLLSVEQVEEIAEELPPLFYELTKRFWPGNLTLVVRKKRHLSSLALGETNSIAVRAISHPLTRRLIEAVGEPLVATSANLYNHPTSISRQDVIDQLGGRVVAFLDGSPKPSGTASTILSLLEPKPQLLRQGKLSIEEFIEGRYNNRR